MRNSEDFMRISHFLISLMRTWEKEVIRLILKTFWKFFDNLDYRLIMRADDQARTIPMIITEIIFSHCVSCLFTMTWGEKNSWSMDRTKHSTKTHTPLPPSIYFSLEYIAQCGLYSKILKKKTLIFTLWASETVRLP